MSSLLLCTCLIAVTHYLNNNIIFSGNTSTVIIVNCIRTKILKGIATVTVAHLVLRLPLKLAIHYFSTLFPQVWTMEQIYPERWWQAFMKESNRESFAPMKTMSPMWAVWSSPSWAWKLWVLCISAFPSFSFEGAVWTCLFCLFSLVIYYFAAVCPLCYLLSPSL